jgi:hypothetical protein
MISKSPNLAFARKTSTTQGRHIIQVSGPEIIKCRCSDVDTFP